MQWNQGVYLKPDVWQHQPCQLPHLSPSEMQYPGASGFWISPIEEQDINVKFTQTAPHAHSHHAPVAYGAVFPSSQLFWRIIPEKYFPALARMKEHYLCSGFSSLSQAGFTWCLSLTTAVQWAASRKDFSTVVPSPLCLMLSPSYSHSYSLGPSWQPNYLIFTTTYYFYLFNGNIFTLWYVLCADLLYHHVPPSAPLYRDWHPWCQRMQVQ